MLKAVFPLFGLVLGFAFVSMPMDAEMAREAPPVPLVEEAVPVRPAPVEPEAVPEAVKERPAEEEPADE